MKALVTGGAGFIGSNLVDALIERGDEVIIIDNLSTGKKEYINSKAKFYKIDICSDDIKNIFTDEKFDLVFHLAAQIDVRKSVKNPAFDNKVNVLGSLNIFKNCCDYKVKKVVFISTGGAIYGNVEKPAVESDLIKPISPYAIHKYVAERYLELFRESCGFNYTILRLANVYGPRQYKGGECGVVSVFIDNYINGRESILFGDGSKTRDFVYVDDVVRAIILAISDKKNCVYNIGSGIETSMSDLIESIEQVINKNFYYKAAEDKKGEVIRSALDSSKAKKELGWEQKINLREGICRAIKWYKND